MPDYYSILLQTPLFAGITKEELPALLQCLSPQLHTYPKESYVWMAGEPVTHLGVVLSGEAQVVQEDYNGYQSIITQLEVGDIFGEAFAFARTTSSPVSVVAQKDSEILLLDCARITTICSLTCAYHTRLIQNMLAVFAQKNLGLNNKLNYVSQRTTRDKIMAYLSAESQRHQSLSFDIPFNRQELADYLCVDRSALSSELGRMRDEGLLNFSRSHFTLSRSNT